MNTWIHYAYNVLVLTHCNHISSLHYFVNLCTEFVMKELLIKHGQVCMHVDAKYIYSLYVHIGHCLMLT